MESIFVTVLTIAGRQYISLDDCKKALQLSYDSGFADCEAAIANPAPLQVPAERAADQAHERLDK